jgi:hypothetical protein
MERIVFSFDNKSSAIQKIKELYRSGQLEVVCADCGEPMKISFASNGSLSSIICPNKDYQMVISNGETTKRIRDWMRSRSKDISDIEDKRRKVS